MNRIITSLLMIFLITIIQLPMSSTAYAVGAEREAKEKRKTKLPGQSVAKKVAKAFDAFGIEAEDGSNIDNALAILLEIKTRKEFDKAFTNRFIGLMYAQKGSQKEAIRYLKLAITPDVLNEKEQGESLKNIADLQMGEEQYKEAIVSYHAWMDFTGESDAIAWVKLSQANLALEQFKEVIPAADKAIAAYGDKQSPNPYIIKINSYHERKMYKETIKVLETALQLFPETKMFWVQLASLYAMTEDFTKSLSTLDLAYKKGFLTTEREIIMLANLYAQSELPHKTAMLLEKFIDSGVVKRDDKNIKTLANAWHGAQHIDKAADYYGELAKMTNDSKHYKKQGALLNQDEQFTKAIVALKKAIEVGIKNPGSVYQSIAESYYYLEKYKQANTYILKAMKDPKSRRSAKGWIGYIKDAAQRKNITI